MQETITVYSRTSGIQVLGGLLLLGLVGLAVSESLDGDLTPLITSLVVLALAAALLTTARFAVRIDPNQRTVKFGLRRPVPIDSFKQVVLITRRGAAARWTA